MSSGDDSGVRLEAAAVGFPTALATAVGLIIAGSVLLTAQTGFGAGGYVFAWAILIAFILMLAQSASFSAECWTKSPKVHLFSRIRWTRGSSWHASTCWRTGIPSPASESCFPGHYGLLCYNRKNAGCRGLAACQYIFLL